MRSRLAPTSRPGWVVPLLGLLAAMCLAFLGHATLGLGRRGSDLYEHWLYDGIIVGAAVLCLARARHARRDRAAWAAFGLALALIVCGDVYWNSELASLSDPPYPSIADGFWLAYYVPAYIGIVLLMRARVERVRLSGWFDGLIAAFAVTAALAATILDPVLRASGGSFPTVATNLAYPAGDLVLLAFVVATIGFMGWRPGRVWTLLALGLALFAVADTVHLFQAANSTYVEGGLIDAGWPIAALLIAVAAWQPMPRAQSGAMRGPLADQIVPMSFAVLVVGVLVVGLVQPLNLVAGVLAIAAMVAVMARLSIAAYESRQLELSRRQAQTDDLTGLANRRGFYAFADEALALAGARDQPVAMLMLDLDHFKEFNDSLGHGAGDRLLEEVAERIVRSLPRRSIIGRLGGDEFVVLLPAGATRENAEEAARAIQRSLTDPVQLDGLACYAAVSIGIAIGPDHGGDRTTLMRRADTAMYRAKRNATGVESFDSDGSDLARNQIELASELRGATERGELVLHYQPKTNIQSGCTEGVEALLRWEHPRHGLLAPEEFLPVGEAHGLMRHITFAVLEMALAQQAEWRRNGLDIPVAVNLSPADLLDTGFPAEVAGLIERFQTPPGSLELEITENTVMVDPGRVLDVLARLSELGITFALDDYGTGHSSLAYLRRLPVASLKIDRSFVSEMSTENDDAIIVRSTIELARNLGIRVVAEGVETDEHWDQLAAFGCDAAQGFYLSRPLPAADLIAWMARPAPSGVRAA